MTRLKIGVGLVTSQGAEASSGTAVAPSALPTIAAHIEAAGFDTLWASEHHIAEEGYLGSPLIALAIAAGATTRLGLATGVALAPFYHPLRLAEDATALQLMSGGRLLLGLGLAYRDEEFEAFGVPRRTRGRDMSDTVPVLKTLLAGGLVSHEGTWGALANAYVRPVAPVPPPLWLGGYATAAIERAARVADGYLIGGGSIPKMIELLDAFDAHRGERDIAVGAHLTIASSDLGIAQERLEQGLVYQQRVYSRWLAGSRDRPAEPNLSGRLDQMVEQARPLIERMARYREAQILLRLIVPGLSLGEIETVVARAGSDLVPLLRECDNASNHRSV